MFIQQGRPVGWIEVICGPMFSGKTEEMIRRVRRERIAKQRVQIFKPAIDNRYDEDYITSHSEQRFECIGVSDASQILAGVKDATRVVGIDEVQFFDDDIVDVCQKLAYRGVRVLAAGLDQDYLGQPFGPIPRLLAVAEFVTKNQAICMACGGLGTKSQRLAAEGTQVMVGAGESYEARCRACFDAELHLSSSEPSQEVAVPSPMPLHAASSAS